MRRGINLSERIPKLVNSFQKSTCYIVLKTLNTKPPHISTRTTCRGREFSADRWIMWKHQLWISRSFRFKRDPNKDAFQILEMTVVPFQDQDSALANRTVPHWWVETDRRVSLASRKWVPPNSCPATFSWGFFLEPKCLEIDKCVRWMPSHSSVAHQRTRWEYVAGQINGTTAAREIHNDWIERNGGW